MNILTAQFSTKLGTTAGLAPLSGRMRITRSSIAPLALMVPLLGTGAGCSHVLGATSNATPISCDLIRPAFVTDGNGCADPTCGGNSPVTNAFPYNGLHPDGCANEDGAALVTPSVMGNYSTCNHGQSEKLYLDVARVDPDAPESGYQLVARGADNVVRCQGAQLVGTTFRVRTRGALQTLRISQMGTVPVVETAMKRTVYLITPDDQPTNSLCAPPPAAGTSGRSPFMSYQYRPNDVLPDVTGEDFSLYAMVIPGAVYRRDANLIPSTVTTNSGTAGLHPWFNLACVSDGLAQTELSGLARDPIESTEAANARLPWLHMFTAKYCNGISATTRGTPITWTRGDSHSSRIRDEADPIEAQWDNTGAMCVSHSRLWMKQKVISIPYPLHTLEAFKALWAPSPVFTFDKPMNESDFLNMLCGRPACDASSDSNVLTSYTVNHADASVQSASRSP